MSVVFAVGCVLDADSDLMLSSGSLLMSSTGGSDDIMNESWSQQQQQLGADERTLDTDTSLNQCPLDAGKSSKTVVGNNACQDDDVSRANGNTDSVTTCDPATVSRSSVMDSDQSDLCLHPQATSINYETFEPTAEKIMRKIPNETNEQSQFSAATENASEQNSQEIVINENDEIAVEQPVSTSCSASEPQFPTADVTESNADLINLGQASDDIQNEAGPLSVNVVSCQSSSQFQSVMPPPQTVTDPNANKSEIEETDVATKTRVEEEQRIASEQRIQSDSDKTSSKKDAGSSTSKRTKLVATKDKVDGAAVSRSATNPRSTRVTVLTTSKDRRAHGSVDTDKNTPVKSKLKRDNDTAQPDVETDVSLKSSASTQKASDRTATSSVPGRRRNTTERSSSQMKESKKGSAATKETEKTPESTENKKSLSSTAADTKRSTGRRNESQTAEERENKADDNVKETTSKLISNGPANNNQESKKQTSVRHVGKGTSLSARKSSLAKSNPKPKTAEKDPETQRGEARSSNGKQRTKSTGLSQTVSDAVDADRPAEKLPENPSTAGNPGNPGNPKSLGDRATTSGLPTKKQQPQRSPSSRAAADAADKPTTTALQGRGLTQTAKTTQRSDKPSDVAAGDAKAPKSSGKQHARQLCMQYIYILSHLLHFPWRLIRSFASRVGNV